MLPRDLSTTTESHLLALISAQISEGAHLEFKRELPRSDAAGRHELAADVSAFANSAGGDLIFGMEEDGEGRAAALMAQVGNADEEARRVQDMLLNGIEPRLPGLQVLPIQLSDGFVLIVRAPQSWAGPHRVKTNQHFFLRENGRKRHLDVPEVRGLFLRSDQQAKRVRDFRTERLGKLLAGEAPHRLMQGVLLVGHFVPTQAALGTVQVDPIRYVRDRYLPILGASTSGARVNLDGALVVRSSHPEGAYGYSQLFRNGFFETVSVYPVGSNERASLGSIDYEKRFIALLSKLRVEYFELSIDGDMTCMVSIVGADRLDLGIDRFRFMLDDHQGHFDRAILVLPDVLLPSELSSEQALQPVFDLVWQSAGLERSANYNQEGKWIG